MYYEDNSLNNDAISFDIGGYVLKTSFANIQKIGGYLLELVLSNAQSIDAIKGPFFVDRLQEEGKYLHQYIITGSLPAKLDVNTAKSAIEFFKPKGMSEYLDKRLAKKKKHQNKIVVKSLSKGAGCEECIKEVSFPLSVSSAIKHLVNNHHAKIICVREKDQEKDGRKIEYWEVVYQISTTRN
jgi:hypothetical protein